MKKGLEFNHCHRFYRTNLLVAAKSSDTLSIRALLDHGTTLPKDHVTLDSELAKAADRGHRQAVKKVFDAGATINDQGDYLGPPITRVLQKEDMAIACYLSAQGADLNSNSNNNPYECKRYAL